LIPALRIAFFQTLNISWVAFERVFWLCSDEEEEIPEDASADSDFGDEILDSESGSESEKEFGVKKRNK
jgi:hypothetical protein